LIEMMAPYLFRPGVISIVLLFFSLLVPLIEELVKPLGVWLFANKISSPAQGFALGALGGASFALIETLGVSPQTDEWSILLLTRLGTDILHVTTAALMGAGIVYAIRGQRYPRLLGTYFLCVFLHGLWNGLAMLFSFSTLAEQFQKQNPLSGLTAPVGIAIAIYAAILLIVLVTSNRRMRDSQPALPHEEPAS
jgi:RsiW-degrading membrane proteinase PrsW (M82 family)